MDENKFYYVINILDPLLIKNIDTDLEDIENFYILSEPVQSFIEVIADFEDILSRITKDIFLKKEITKNVEYTNDEDAVELGDNVLQLIQYYNNDKLVIRSKIFIILQTEEIDDIKDIIKNDENVPTITKQKYFH